MQVEDPVANRGTSFEKLNAHNEDVLGVLGKGGCGEAESMGFLSGDNAM